MTTGDKKNALAKLEMELRSIKFDFSTNWNADQVTSGDPVAFMGLLRYILFGFSKSVSAHATKWVLDADPDRVFMESVLRMVQRECSEKSSITIEQFFMPGYMEHKAKLCRILIRHCKQLHNETVKQKKEAKETSSAFRNSGSSLKSEDRPGSFSQAKRPMQPLASQPPNSARAISSSHMINNVNVTNGVGTSDLLRRSGGGGYSSAINLTQGTPPVVDASASFRVASSHSPHNRPSTTVQNGHQSSPVTMGNQGEGTGSEPRTPLSVASTPPPINGSSAPSREEFEKLQALVQHLIVRVVQLEMVTQHLQPAGGAASISPSSGQPLAAGTSSPSKVTRETGIVPNDTNGHPFHTARPQVGEGSIQRPQRASSMDTFRNASSVGVNAGVPRLRLPGADDPLKLSQALRSSQQQPFSQGGEGGVASPNAAMGSMSIFHQSMTNSSMAQSNFGIRAKEVLRRTNELLAKHPVDPAIYSSRKNQSTRNPLTTALPQSPSPSSIAPPLSDAK